MLDSSMQIQLIEVQHFEPRRILLTDISNSKFSRQVSKWVADEGPDACRRVVMMFQEGAVCERCADGIAYTEFLHGRFQLGVAYVATVARDVAVIGEGVDDRAGAAEICGGCG